MKNKYYLYGLFAAALTLTGCDYNEDHFPGYDELAQPKDVWNDTITLADADYKTIAGIEANKEPRTRKERPSRRLWRLWQAINISPKRLLPYGIYLRTLPASILIWTTIPR